MYIDNVNIESGLGNQRNTNVIKRVSFRRKKLSIIKIVISYLFDGDAVTSHIFVGVCNMNGSKVFCRK